MSRRRVFDIDFPDDGGPGPGPSPEAAVPVGTGLAADAAQGAAPARRGPMAAAIAENAEALRRRQEAEAAIRAENDRLAHEMVRLKKLGLIVDLIPLGAIRAEKLTRDRAQTRDPELDELKDSIRAVGLSNPIRVEEAEGGYELVQGFRRLAAYRELHAETGDARYAAIPAGLVTRGETLESLYRRMVDENLVRRDISFAEMAELARAYVADAATDAVTIDQAIAALYASAGRQKRVYIRNFASLLDRIGDHLRHAHAVPRALGLALLKRIEREPGAQSLLLQRLAAAPDRSEEGELAILRAFAERFGPEAAESPSQPPRGAGQPGAKTSLRVARGAEIVRCTATVGRVEMRLDRDFSALDRHRLQQAVEAFLDVLDS